VDIEPVANLAARFYREEGFATPYEELRRNLLALIDSDSADVEVACTPSGAVVAFAATTSTLGLEHCSVAELQDLYVLPEHRGVRVAEALIERSVAWAQTKGCQVLDVVVDADGDARHQLARYYTRRGFADEGRRLLTRQLSSKGS
jgi:aminoglycoside 6'-N-acetyltransferase I